MDWAKRERRYQRYYEAIPREVYESNGYLINARIVRAFMAIADDEITTALAAVGVPADQEAQGE